LVCFGVGRRMMLALFSSLEASSCLFFMLLSHWCLGVSLSVMCLPSWGTLFVQVRRCRYFYVFLLLVFLWPCWSSCLSCCVSL
jgi:hypothetical protein